MAALLVGLSIMAVMLTVVMPVWKQSARREREEELVFRGEQYARAIGLFQRKNGPGALPPNVDFLVEQRYLRKKYKDPVANDDFVPILLGAATAQGARGQGQPPGLRATGPGAGGFPAASAGAQSGGAPGAAVGGVTGVTSKNKEESIRLYKGRNHYNEWQFVFTPPAQAPGAGGPAGPGGPRGRGQGPGGSQGPLFPPGVGGPGGPQGAPGGGRGRGFLITPDGRIEQVPPPGPNGPAGPARGPGPPPRGR